MTLIKKLNKELVQCSWYNLPFKQCFYLFVIALAVCFSPLNFAKSQDVSIAVAANFIAPMKELESAFEAQHPAIDIKLSPGSSGKLFTQIMFGAPYALFFSADQSYPGKLIEKGVALSDSAKTYATGSLVLASRDLNTSPKQLLKQESFNKLAIANPDIAPYGKAAIETLQSLSLHQQSLHKLVKGESISQTFQFVYSENAELGFIAKSQWLAQQTKLNGWLVPTNLHSQIKQDVVMLKKGEKSKGAKLFYQFVFSKKGQKIITNHGYETVK